MKRRLHGKGGDGVVRGNEREEQALAFRGGPGRGERPSEKGAGSIRKKRIKRGTAASPQEKQKDVSGCGSADSVSVRRSGGMVSERKPHQRTGESLVCGDA